MHHLQHDKYDEYDEWDTDGWPTRLTSSNALPDDDATALWIPNATLGE